MEDYAVMRRKLEAWYAELDQLDQQFQAGTRDRDRAMDQFEQELEAILAECQPTATVPTMSEGGDTHDSATMDAEPPQGALLGQPVPETSIEELPESTPESRAGDRDLNEAPSEEAIRPMQEPAEVIDAPSAVSLVAPQNQSRRRVVMPPR